MIVRISQFLIMFGLLLPILTAQQRCRPKPLGLKATITGNLGPGCRVSDFLSSVPGADAWVDAYEVDLSGPGKLSVRLSSDVFNASLRVLRENVSLLGENDDAVAPGERGDSGLDAALHLDLPRGRYLILASGRSGAGVFRLTTDFVERCPLSTMEAETTVSGTLADTSCRSSDLLGSGGNWARQYALELHRRGKLALETQITAGLYSRVYRRFPEGATLEPGEYRIIVESANRGAYRLRAHFSATCPVRNIAPGETVAGAFSSSDCTQRDLNPSSRTNHYIKQFEIEVPQRGAVRVNSEPQLSWTILNANERNVAPGNHVFIVTSAEFTPFRFHVEMNPACRLEPFEVDHSTTGFFDDASCRAGELESGRGSFPAREYEIAVGRRGRLKITTAPKDASLSVRFRGVDPTAWDAEIDVVPGSYRFIVEAPRSPVKYTIQAHMACPEIPLHLGEAVDGDISPQDCSAVGEVPSSQDPQIVIRKYSVSIPRRGTFDVKVTSQLPVGITLLDGQSHIVIETPVASTTSETTLELNQGTYVLAIKAKPQAAAMYILRARFEPLRCSVRPLSLESKVGPATFESHDCRMNDLTEAADSHYAHQYLLTVKESGRLGVHLSPKGFRPVLSLLDSGRRQVPIIALPGGDGADTYAHLTVGQYMLIVEGPSAAIGSYQLTTTFHASIGTALRLGESTEDRQFPDETEGAYRLEVPKPARVVLEIESPNSEAVLRLYSESGTQLLADSKTLRAVPARVIRPFLPAGRYRIAVVMSPTGSGAFRLDTRKSQVQQSCDKAIWTGTLNGNATLTLSGRSASSGTLRGTVPVPVPDVVRAYRAETSGLEVAVRPQPGQSLPSPIDGDSCIPGANIRFYSDRVYAPSLPVTLKSADTIQIHNDGKDTSAIVIEWEIR